MTGRFGWPSRGTPPEWAPGLAEGAAEGPMGSGPMGGPGMHRFPPDGVSFLIQVRLQDGTWATFDTQVTQESASLPWRVLLTLATLLAAVLLLSYIAVRWVTRPLHLLATAADELGRDINRPPLPEGGPAEVSRAAHAFNTMQTRLVRFIDERTRLLTAMSHDLKTPLTRMRLRAEMLEDGSLREKFEADLLEMEAMVTQTLEFMRGLSHREPAQLVDIMGLLESLQADNEAMGRTVTIDGRVTRPLERRTAAAQALHLEPGRQRCPLRQASGDPVDEGPDHADHSSARPRSRNTGRARSRRSSSRSIASKARAAAKRAERGWASASRGTSRRRTEGTFACAIMRTAGWKRS